MLRLEELRPHAIVRGIVPDAVVSVVGVQWFGTDALELIYKDPTGRVASVLLYRDDERYRLGQLLSGLTRHFLLLTATPHNGKEEDFQLFLALLRLFEPGEAPLKSRNRERLGGRRG